MADGRSPQERIASARRLHAVLKDHLNRPTWTPFEGALVASGLYAPEHCAALPHNGTALDGRAADVMERLLKAREIIRLWEWYCEDDEECGRVTPSQLEPHEFLSWCLSMEIDTVWLQLLLDVISGGKSQSDRPEWIPVAVAEYADQAGNALNAIHSIAGNVSGGSSANSSTLTKAEKSASRIPMPVPVNRDHVSTEELAAILAIEPQSILKSHSKDGSYLGIRPIKLPNRRLMWPVTGVKILLSGEQSGVGAKR